MKEVIKKIRRYEIKIRKEVKSRLQGDFHSIFKGSGLEFDDVRAYQYGDEVRTIDWNVSAKGHGTFVKTFREEKEQNIFFIVDVSGSQEIGSLNSKKIDIGKEVCAILALSAVRENSTVGLIGYSDCKEIFIPAKKGLKHAYYIILKLFKLNPKSVKTNLNACLTFCLSFLKKKSIIILISDFIDQNYEKNLAALASKHHVVVIHLTDPVEFNTPKFGIIPILDIESKKIRWVNTSSASFRKKLQTDFAQRKKNLENLCKQSKINYLLVDIKEDYIPYLVKLFKHRRF